MDISQAKRLLIKVAEIICNPLLVPSYLFILFCLSVPLCRLYFILYPKLFFLLLFLLTLTTLFIPLLFYNYCKKRQIENINTVFLLFVLLINVVSLLIIKRFQMDIGNIPFRMTLIIVLIANIELLIFSTIQPIKWICVVIGLLLGCITLILPIKNFLCFSTAFLLSGGILSLLLDREKMTIKQMIYNLCIGFTSICFSMLFLG